MPVWETGFGAFDNMAYQTTTKVRTAAAIMFAGPEFGLGDTALTGAEEAYNASGQRVLRRTSGSGGTQLLTYAFGLQDSTYNGIKIKAVYSYNRAGRLIGRVEGGAINSFVTNELGTPLTNISAGDNSAEVNGNQLYGPYGNQRTLQGWLGTDRGFTGQYSDATGLDYYNARYYDPRVGVFLSADTVQGNVQGMDPYSYVGENPETKNDPTGQHMENLGGGGDGGDGSGSGDGYCSSGRCYGGDGQQTYRSDNHPIYHYHGDGSGHSKKKSAPHYLTGDQLDNWCLNDAQCNYNLEAYQWAQDSHDMLNGLQFAASFFPLFEGNPEALEQYIEEAQAAGEDTTILLQMLQDESGLDDAVSAKLASPDESDQVEGQAGAIVALYSKLIRFNFKYGVGGSDGEVDAESPNAIIEAKSGGLKGQISDLIKKFTNPFTNPSGKPFVIYAPGWNDNNAMTVYSALGSLDTGRSVYVATSPEQLIEIVSYLDEGAPSA